MRQQLHAAETKGAATTTTTTTTTSVLPPPICFCSCCCCCCPLAVNACPGDLVHLDGVMPPAAYPKVLKTDDWRQVVPGLVVRGGKVRQDRV